MRFFGPPYWLLLISFTTIQGVINAQGKINVPATECLGNLTSFTYTPPAGLTLSSASWDFGDGNNSTNLAPLHTYSFKGFYIIKINATFTNASTRTDSVKIEVVGLPKAAFYLLPSSDSCLSRNFLKYKDTSRPAKTGQTITNRLIVWGDGTFDNTVNPGFGSIISHSYNVAAKYTLKLEVTDKFGCKSSMSQSMSVLENIDADANVDTLFIDCKSAQICVKNISTGTYRKSASYQWHIDTSAIDTNASFNTPKCVRYTKERRGLVMLTVTLNGFCPDTFRQGFYNRLDALPTKITLMDSIWCWGDGSSFEVTANKTSNCDKCNWRLNGIFSLPFYPHYYIPPSPILPSYPKSDSVISFPPKDFLLPGKALIEFYIYRGNNACILRDSFNIRGPMSDIISYDNQQCYTNRQVFFRENAKYANKKNLTYFWDITDPNGQNCINNRTKGINLYKNCNQSVDWYTKHVYGAATSDNPVYLTVKDTVTGCEHTAKLNVDFKYCPPILRKDSVVLCQGDIFLAITQPFPEAVTLDSGKTWRKFGFVIDSSMNGLYTIGFAFKTLKSPWAENFGTDSIKIHSDTITYLDTVYRSKFLRVYPLHTENLDIKVYGNCKPFRATVYLKKKTFKKGESLNVNFQDGISFGMVFKSDTIIDSVTHLYNKTGLETSVRVSLVTEKGCEWRQNIDIVFGKGFGMYIPDRNRKCGNKPVCINATVLDLKSKYYWTNNQTLGNRRLSWQFENRPDTLINEFNPCHLFKNTGKQPFKMILRDSVGCKDTMYDTLFIQDVRADVNYLSKIVYCSELKQFFDSSTYIKVKGGDSIIKYSWKFGNNVYSSFVKNPLQVINTSLDSITVLHAVEMLRGCTDTVSFTLKIIGPHPYFQIKDTIGCGSLNATFINQSKNSNSFLWEFGDSLTSTLQTASKKDVTFTYNKPGRYYIYLTGYDTVTNPLSGKTFYCKNTFPDKLFQKDTTRSVLVLPYRTTGIQSKDTICLGSALVLKSLSEPGYDFDYWQMGDSTTYTLATGSSVSHLYKKEGLFKVKLNPGYTDSLQNKLCRDSAQKDILVVGVKADFTIDPIVIPPLFQFYNKSAPTGALLRWDFGQSGSGSNNSSTDQNPSHHYGNDTGTYNVCLIASIPQGCSDTICKTVYNDHLTELKLFNVFTPGSLDGKNDQYDILIEGEALYDLKIYNRWGILVFEGDKDGDQTNQDNWNGKVLNKGAECPSGTYYYIFRYSLRTEPDNIKTITGVITLIR